MNNTKPPSRQIRNGRYWDALNATAASRQTSSTCSTVWLAEKSPGPAGTQSEDLLRHRRIGRSPVQCHKTRLDRWPDTWPTSDDAPASLAQNIQLIVMVIPPAPRPLIPFGFLSRSPFHVIVAVTKQHGKEPRNHQEKLGNPVTLVRILPTISLQRFEIRPFGSASRANPESRLRPRRQSAYKIERRVLSPIVPGKQNTVPH
jgi:hypothetical protein